MLVLLGYLLLFGSNVYEAVFGRIVMTITRHGAAPPYLLVFVFLIAGAISLKITAGNRSCPRAAVSARC